MSGDSVELSDASSVSTDITFHKAGRIAMAFFSIGLSLAAAAPAFAGTPQAPQSTAAKPTQPLPEPPELLPPDPLALGGQYSPLLQQLGIPAPAPPMPLTQSQALASSFGVTPAVIDDVKNNQHVKLDTLDSIPPDLRVMYRNLSADRKIKAAKMLNGHMSNFSKGKVPWVANLWYGTTDLFDIMQQRLDGGIKDHKVSPEDAKNSQAFINMARKMTPDQRNALGALMLSEVNLTLAPPQK